MKTDKVTGKKTPENRVDEISLVLEEINKFVRDSNGTADKQIENNALLRELNVSMALIVDMLGLMTNNMIAKEKAQYEKEQREAFRANRAGEGEKIQ